MKRKSIQVLFKGDVIKKNMNLDKWKNEQISFLRM